jgi:hypothetical protein
MTTTTSIAARRLVAYLDADETSTEVPGSPGRITANRPALARLIDELRLAIAAEDAEVER